MNIENLQQGEVYKNYIAMCEILCEEVKGGKAKILQVKDWERYFEHERDGNRWVITKIYTEVKPKVDLRGGNNNYYKDYIRNQIIFFFSRQMKNEPAVRSLCGNVWEFEITPITLARNISMVSKDFLGNEKQNSQISEITKIKIEFVNEFYAVVGKTIYDAVLRALDGLEKEGIVIFMEKVKVLNITEYDEIANRTQPIYRDAHLAELTIIEESEKKALKVMELNNIQEVKMKGKTKEFYKTATEIVKERIPKLRYYFSIQRIRFSGDLVKEFVESITMEENEQMKLQLNKMVSERMLKNAINRHMKAAAADKSSYSHSLKSDAGYPQNYQVLLERVQSIKSDRDNICDINSSNENIESVDKGNFYELLEAG